MPVTVLDIEQHLLLLELHAPFDKRAVQLARRRMAKRWHPDVAPQGRQFEHERHLKAINEAADQLERLAEGSRGGRVSRNAVRASAAAARREREESGRRAYEAEQRARAQASERAKHDPFASRVPDHSVVHRYARCLSYPEWGVGTVAGIYFSGDPDGDAEVQQWARVRFSHGVRTVPAGSMRFVDFSKPDPAEESGRRAYEAEQRARAHASERAKHDPFASRVPDHSVVHRYARCLSYPEWGVGTVAGIYFSGDPDGDAEVQQWARVRFSHGVRTVPAGSMRFVDFSKPDPAEERAERYMTAAQRAMAEGEYRLAAQRLVYARDAEPRNVAVLRQMTLAFWQAGNLDAAARSVRDWARVDGNRPAAHRFAARIYEDIGAIDLAEEAAERAALRGPSDAGAWERLGRLRMRLLDREGALQALERALKLEDTGPLRDLLAAALAMEPTAAPASVGATGC